MVDLSRMIETTQGYVGGRPRIAGTSIAVASIALLNASGRSPQQIISDIYPHITLAQVHAALAYYFVNQEAIDQRVASDNALFDDAAGLAVAAR
jgi:uncharacterized protein (DUF433 family)